MENENTDTVRRCYSEVWNNGNPEAITELMQLL